MVESSFYNALSSAPAVSAIVGTRIYPLLVPTDSPLPAIDYSIIAGSTTGTFSTRGPSKLRVEVNCWGTTYGDAVTLRAAVIDAIGLYNDGVMTIRFLMPHDFFDHDLLQYRACCEFYVTANL